MPSEVELGKVKDGAVLAADVADSHGNVLLAAGTRLTGAHLSLLDRRGTKSVVIVLPGEDVGSEEAKAAPDAAELAEALARQERVFSKVRGQPVMETIYRVARAHLEAGNVPLG